MAKYMTSPNTNPDSLSQKFLRSHQLMSPLEQSRHTPEELAEIRKRKAHYKMMEMSPEQKRAEIIRLQMKLGK